MYDSKKVIIGLIIFVALVSLPFWIGLGNHKPMAEPVVKKGVGQCVESKEFMRANHMQLLDEWRNDVVRRSDTVYTSSTGQKFEKSLTKTCLDCHSNKEEFCDRCHDYLDVKPYCWNCHLTKGGDSDV